MERNEPTLEMTGSFYHHDRIVKTAFPMTHIVPFTVGMFLLAPLTPHGFNVRVFLSFPPLKRINTSRVVFPSHFLCFQETLKQDEQCHLPVFVL